MCAFEKIEQVAFRVDAVHLKSRLQAVLEVRASLDGRNAGAFRPLLTLTLSG